MYIYSLSSFALDTADCTDRLLRCQHQHLILFSVCYLYQSHPPNASSIDPS